MNHTYPFNCVTHITIMSLRVYLDLFNYYLECGNLIPGWLKTISFRNFTWCRRCIAEFTEIGFKYFE